MCPGVTYWTQMHRQVRIDGRGIPAYGRRGGRLLRHPAHDSRLAVWVANQSTPVPGREYLEDRMAEIARRYPDDTVPRPTTWVGYRVVPDSVEYWQGRESRLHDRLLYTREGGGWKIVRLAP